MTIENFPIWLAGFVEIHQGPPTPTEWAVISATLDSCFKKVTPNYNDTFTRISGLNLPPGVAC